MWLAALVVPYMNLHRRMALYFQLFSCGTEPVQGEQFLGLIIIFVTNKFIIPVYVPSKEHESDLRLLLYKVRIPEDNGTVTAELGNKV